jgi:hypothetical protein
MSLTNDLIEKHISRAHARGDFDNLPGAGKPLDLGEDAHLPAELRMAYRVLKNAGYVPEELQQIQDIAQLEAQLYGTLDEGADNEGVQKRAALKLRLLSESMRGDPLALQQYRAQLLVQLAAKNKT